MEMKLSAEQIESIVSGAAESLKKSIVEDIKQTLHSRVKWALDEEIGVVVSAFFKEHVKPELEAELVAQRDLIIRQVATAAISAGEVLANRLCERAVKNLSDTYQSDNVIKALFAR